jgi:hypothetical protein
VLTYIVIGTAVVTAVALMAIAVALLILARAARHLAAVLINTRPETVR